MDRETVLKLWEESWTVGSGVAPWSKAVDGLTPEQAAWRPGPDRHSIWQIVNHVCIWREFVVAKSRGDAGLALEEVYARNFEEPGAATEEAWRETVDRLQRSHEAMRGIITDAPEARLEHAMSHFGHDSYHLGQVMFLRAMQGLGPVV